MRCGCHTAASWEPSGLICRASQKLLIIIIIIITQDLDSTLALRVKVSPRASWVGNWARSTNELTDNQCRCLWNMESHPFYTGESSRILSPPVVLYAECLVTPQNIFLKIKFLRQQRERSKDVLQNKSFIFWIHQQNSLKI